MVSAAPAAVRHSLPRRGTPVSVNLPECCIFFDFGPPSLFRQALCSMQYAWTVADLNTTSADVSGRAASVAGWSRGRQLAEQIPLQGVKVMVIDDSNTIRRSAEIFLLQAGCTVILAEDGFDALAKITDHQPDLVFVDIMMPRLDGYQTCALIKKNTKFQRTPVIMLSSKDGLFDRARGRMVGSDQYLTKPFTKESLLKAVAAHTNRAAA
jgi:twitching motility two-component system response regulator PilG